MWRPLVGSACILSQYNIILYNIIVYIEEFISGPNERPGDKPTPSNSSSEGGEQGLAAEGAHDLNQSSQINL